MPPITAIFRNSHPPLYEGGGGGGGGGGGYDYATAF